jgi:hypothetical protein
MGSASTAAPLIEKDDSVDAGVPEPSVHRARTTAWPSMKENGRLSQRIPALLVIDRMNRIDAKVPGIVRLDFWK